MSRGVDTPQKHMLEMPSIEHSKANRSLQIHNNKMCCSAGNDEVEKIELKDFGLKLTNGYKNRKTLVCNLIENDDKIRLQSTRDASAVVTNERAHDLHRVQHENERTRRKNGGLSKETFDSRQ